jgi:hypothetical protein
MRYPMTFPDKAQHELAAIRVSLSRADSADPGEWQKIVRKAIHRIDRLVEGMDKSVSDTPSLKAWKPKTRSSISCSAKVPLELGVITHHPIGTP